MSRQQDAISIDLVVKAKGGDNRAFENLLNILEPDLRKLASRYYIKGSDYQDVLQEGRLGILKAVNDFDPDGRMAFRNFAINVCCKRHIITQMMGAMRKKYALLNNALSLEQTYPTGEDDSEQPLSEFLIDQSPSALDAIIIREEYEINTDGLRGTLTELEEKVFDEYSYDESYRDIAKALGVKAKTVDNALMRIRKKAADIYRKWLQTDRDFDLLEIISEEVEEMKKEEELIKEQSQDG